MYEYEDHLDIFTDASISDPKLNGKMTMINIACYGALCIGDMYRCYDYGFVWEPTDKYGNRFYQNYNSDMKGSVTNNVAEANAILLGLELATYIIESRPPMNPVKYVNLFADSNLCVQSLRNWICGWMVNRKLCDDGRYTLIKKSEDQPVINQEIYLDCVDRILRLGIPINIYHINGHISGTDKSIANAKESFKRANKIQGYISDDYIRYLTENNNIVDMDTRNRITTFLHFNNIPFNQNIFNGKYDHNFRSVLPKNIICLTEADGTPIKINRNLPAITFLPNDIDIKNYKELVSGAVKTNPYNSYNVNIK